MSLLSGTNLHRAAKVASVMHFISIIYSHILMCPRRFLRDVLTVRGTPAGRGLRSILRLKIYFDLDANMATRGPRARRPGCIFAAAARASPGHRSLTPGDPAMTQRPPAEIGMPLDEVDT